MKDKVRMEPAKELLDKVIFTAETKTKLPLDLRGLLNAWGVYCRVNRLPDGALFYQAGGKFIAQLRFAVEKDGSIKVRKYKPGDWERKLILTYDDARFRAENLQKGKEMEELLAGVKDAEEKIRRFEQRASEVPNQANYWSTILMLEGLYREVGRFKDAEKAAISAVEAWPNHPLPHFDLYFIYYIAVLNTKRVKVGEANAQFIRTHGARATELTPEALGYTYKQTYALAERYIEKTLELTQPKYKKIMQKKLSELKAIDMAPGFQEFEEAVNKNPDSATGWSELSYRYMEAGKFKDAEKAANTAVSLSPGIAELHFALSTIYYGALCNSKSITSAKQLPKELTVEVLECNDEYARQMVETHAVETIRLSRDKELTKAAEYQLANLRLMNEM